MVYSTVEIFKKYHLSAPVAALLKEYFIGSCHPYDVKVLFSALPNRAADRACVQNLLKQLDNIEDIAKVTLKPYLESKK